MSHTFPFSSRSFRLNISSVWEHILPRSFFFFFFSANLTSMIMKSLISSAADICSVLRQKHSFVSGSTGEGERSTGDVLWYEILIAGTFTWIATKCSQTVAGSFGWRKGKKEQTRGNTRGGEGERERQGEREGGGEGGELQSIRVTDCRSWRDKSILWGSAVDAALQGWSFG